MMISMFIWWRWTWVLIWVRPTFHPTDSSTNKFSLERLAWPELHFMSMKGRGNWPSLISVAVADHHGVFLNLSCAHFRSRHNRFVHSKQVTINYTLCSKCTHCHDQCQICPTCTDEEATDILKEAYLEHVNRGHFKRVFPSIGQDVSGLTVSNQWMSAWFEAKCKQDSTWCNWSHHCYWTSIMW